MRSLIIFFPFLERIVRDVHGQRCEHSASFTHEMRAQAVAGEVDVARADLELSQTSAKVVSNVYRALGHFVVMIDNYVWGVSKCLPIEQNYTHIIVVSLHPSWYEQFLVSSIYLNPRIKPVCEEFQG